MGYRVSQTRTRINDQTGSASEGLRMTPVGPLPQDWRVVPLRDVVEAVELITPSRTPEWRFKYVDVSSVSNVSLPIESYREYLGRNAPSRARKKLAAADVIFATVRPYLRRVALVPPPPGRSRGLNSVLRDSRKTERGRQSLFIPCGVQ